MMTPNKILLFDIDWTLLKGTGKVFIDGHRQALREILGVNLESDFDITPHEGKTAAGFFVDLAEERGVDRSITRAKLPEIIKFLADFCRGNQEGLNIEILPSAKEAVEGLTKAGFGMGLVTGNPAPVAFLKLELVGLDKYFTFGGFGDESETRSDLVDKAIERAEEQYKRHFDKTDVILVGDNTRDMACGLEAGVYTVGVASGLAVDKQKLRDSGAHLVLPSLSEWQSIISFSQNPENPYVKGIERKS